MTALSALHVRRPKARACTRRRRNHAPVTRHIDNAMVKAIARAFRWCEMLAADYQTIREIASAERINESYVGRVLRLTLLAPDIVERNFNPCLARIIHRRCAIE